MVNGKFQLNLIAAGILLYCVVFIYSICGVLAASKSESISQIAESKVEGSEGDLRLQKQAFLKGWRQLRPGMSPEEVGKIVGEPKLIQSGSHECVWFYQDVPFLNAIPHFLFRKGDQKKDVKNRYGLTIKRIALSDVGGIRDGLVFFESKTTEDLIYEEQAKLETDIAKEAEKATKDKASYCVPRIRHFGGPWEYPPNEREKLSKAHDLIEQRFEDSAKNMKNYYNRRLTALQENPRDPVFTVKFFNQPDWDRFEDLMSRETKSALASAKWEDPKNWKILKLNMTHDKVYKILGEPKNTESNVQASKDHYGDVRGHGELCYEPDINSEERLVSWIEPFWPDVLKQTEDASGQKILFDQIQLFNGKIIQHTLSNIILAKPADEFSEDVFILDEQVYYLEPMPVVKGHTAAIELSPKHPLIDAPDGTFFQIYVTHEGVYKYTDSRGILQTVNKYVEAKLPSSKRKGN